MSKQKPYQNELAFLPLAPLIELLKQENFAIGVETHLHIQQLLNTLPPGTEITTFKDYLCALVAHNETQQQQFSKLYDTYCKSYGLDVHTPQGTYAAKKANFFSDSELNKAIKDPNPVFFTFNALLVFIICLLSIGALTQAYQNYVIKQESEALLQAINQQEQENTQVDTNQQQAPNDSKSKPPSVNGVPSIEDIVEKPKAAAKQYNISLSLMPNRTVNVKSLQINWLQRHAYLLLFAFCLAATIVFFTYLLYKQRTKQAYLERKLQKPSPDVYSINLAKPNIRIFKNNQFYELANKLRQREQSENVYLDIVKTAEATAAAGGYPTFNYKNDSRPVEYLVLIDEKHPRSHQSQLYARFVEELSKQDLFIATYYYNTDPRLLWQTQGGDKIYLSELAQQYPHYRLIMIGDGRFLLSGKTGKWRKWTSLFHTWQVRILLSPIVPVNWSKLELKLNQQFIILPASTAALKNMEVLKQQKFNPFALQDYSLLVDLPNINIDADNPKQVQQLVEDLPFYLGKQVFTWLCACAVYPELQWSLSIALAQLIAPTHTVSLDEQHPLLSPVAMANLFQLPWFERGYIPDAIRHELIKQLPNELHQKVLDFLVQVLKDNPPPAECYAYDAYQLNLLVMQAQQQNDKQKIAQKQLKKLLDKDEELQQITALQYQPLANELSLQLKNKKFNDYTSNWDNLISSFKNVNSRTLITGLSIIVLAGIFSLYQHFRQSEQLIKCNRQTFSFKNDKQRSKLLTYMAYNGCVTDTLPQFLYEEALFLDSTNSVAKHNYLNFLLVEKRFDKLKKLLKQSFDMNELGTDTIEAFGRYSDAYLIVNVGSFSNNTQFKLYNMLQNSSGLSDGGEITSTNVVDSLLNFAERTFDEKEMQMLQSARIVSFANNNYPMAYTMYEEARYDLSLAWLQYTHTLPVSNSTTAYGLYARAAAAINYFFQLEIENEEQLQQQQVLQQNVVDNAPFYTGEQDTLWAYTLNNLDTLTTYHPNFIDKTDAIVQALNDYYNTLNKGYQIETRQQIRRIFERIGIDVRNIDQQIVNNLLKDAVSLIKAERYTVALRELTKIGENYQYASEEINDLIQTCVRGIENQSNDVSNWVQVAKKLEIEERFDESEKFYKRALLTARKLELKEVEAQINDYLKELREKELRAKSSIIKNPLDIFKGKNKKSEQQSQTKEEEVESSIPDEKTPTNFTVPEMVSVPAAEHTFGCNGNFGSCKENEKPPITIYIPSFEIAKYEVTNAEFVQFLNDIGTIYQQKEILYDMYASTAKIKQNDNRIFEVAATYANHPVTHVSWRGATAYAEWLSKQTRNSYRLPTELEWEYAASGTAYGQAYNYAGSNNIEEVAWYLLNSEQTTHAIGGKNNNAFDLYDMSGNAAEWCSDWYDENLYKIASKGNVRSPSYGTKRVVRGGSWNDAATFCRISARAGTAPEESNNKIGFRLAKTITTF